MKLLCLEKTVKSSLVRSSKVRSGHVMSSHYYLCDNCGIEEDIGLGGGRGSGSSFVAG